MSRRAYRVAYDGRPFHGFQRQPSVPTVEGELFAALQALGVYDDGGDDDGEPEESESGGDSPAAGAVSDPPPGYAAAGRTDAGVSALAQTVAFDAPPWLTPRAFSSELPGSVRVWAAADAPSGFHATHDARRRRYDYHLHAPPARADDDGARRVADALAGEHDFHNLTPDEMGTVRDLSLSVARDGEWLVVSAAADGFARQLVRRLASVVAAGARGEAGGDRVERILAPDPLPGPEGVAPAPPEPLVLVDVDYPALDFGVDDAARDTARSAFERRRREALRAARVTGAVLSGLDDDGE